MVAAFFGYTKQKTCRLCVKKCKTKETTLSVVSRVEYRSWVLRWLGIYFSLYLGIEEK